MSSKLPTHKRRQRLDNLKFISLLDEPKPNYEKIWNDQKELIEEIRLGRHPETILFCEHEAVLTTGRRTRPENILSHNLPVYEIERGGDVTLHAPGQLVIYLLIKLKGGVFSGGLHSFLRMLEDCISKTLLHFEPSLEFDRAQPTGLWIRPLPQITTPTNPSISKNPTTAVSALKIASIGIAVRHWVTYHGIAINISNDLTLFRSIRPCDFGAEVMTRLSDWTSSPVALHQVAKRFQEVISLQLNSISDENSSNF